jgi:hypothetical protein
MVGAPIDDVSEGEYKNKKKVNLPYFIGSLNKIKAS